MASKFRKFLLLSAFIPFLMAAGTAWGNEKQSVSEISGPKVKELYLVIIRDPDAGVMAAEKGDIDIIGDIARPVDIKRLSGNPELDLSLARAFHGFFCGFNIRRFPWNIKELRQAACMAIPRMRIVRDIFSGYAAPLSSFLPPASPYAAPEIHTPDFDPYAARILLSDKGWRWDSDGVLIPPGQQAPLKKMKLLTPTEQVAPTTAELATRIAGSLKEIGIPIETDPMDFATMIAPHGRARFRCIRPGMAHDTGSRLPFRFLPQFHGRKGRIQYSRDT